MKRLLPFVPLLLLGALLLSPAAALAGARHGLDLWWTRVFPALLPCFMAVRLMGSLGLLDLGGRRPRGRLLLAMGFSLLSGAPNGARLMKALTEEGGLSPRAGERLLPLVNSVSPAFLVSIIASELLKNKALFLPMAAAFYGCILCLLAMEGMRRPVPAPSPAPAADKAAPFAEALTDAIARSMLDMLRVGGCMVLACTVLGLLEPVLPGPAAYAALAACMEVSTGAAAIAALSLPLRVNASLIIGAAAFGGLSLGLQTACCWPGVNLGRYLFRKLLLGILTGGVCYLLIPLFPGIAAAFASRQEMMSRGLAVSALLLSSLLSLAFMGVLSLMLCARKRSPSSS